MVTSLWPRFFWPTLYSILLLVSKAGSASGESGRKILRSNRPFATTLRGVSRPLLYKGH